MPTNRRRRSRAREEIDSLKIEDLFYGPGTCLLNGCGYLATHGDGFWRDKSPEVQGQVLAAMRADWKIAHRVVMRAWEERDEHDLWIAERHHGNPAQPWAQTEFGEEVQ